jgi:cell division septation protein DedD
MFSYSVTGGATWNNLAYVNTADDGSFLAVWMPSASGNYLVRGICAGDSVYSAVITTINFGLSPSNDQAQDMFSVASNSTITSLMFDSTVSKLSFTVSGTSGTTAYVNIIVPKSLLGDVTNLRLTLDDSSIAYTYLQSGNEWLIVFVCHCSTHNVVMALNSQTPTATPTSNPTSTQTVAPTTNPTSNPTSSTATPSPTATPTATPGAPEFPPLIIVSLLLVAVSLATVITLKKRAKTKT